MQARESVTLVKVAFKREGIPLLLVYVPIVDLARIIYIYIYLAPVDFYYGNPNPSQTTTYIV